MSMYLGGTKSGWLGRGGAVKYRGCHWNTNKQCVASSLGWFQCWNNNPQYVASFLAFHGLLISTCLVRHTRAARCKHIASSRRAAPRRAAPRRATSRRATPRRAVLGGRRCYILLLLLSLRLLWMLVTISIMIVMSTMITMLVTIIIIICYVWGWGACTAGRRCSPPRCWACRSAAVYLSFALWVWVWVCLWVWLSLWLLLVLVVVVSISIIIIIMIALIITVFMTIAISISIVDLAGQRSGCTTSPSTCRSSCACSRPSWASRAPANVPYHIRSHHIIIWCLMQYNATYHNTIQYKIKH